MVVSGEDETGGEDYGKVVAFLALFETLVAELQCLLVGSCVESVVDELVLAVVAEGHCLEL